MIDIRIFYYYCLGMIEYVSLNEFNISRKDIISNLIFSIYEELVECVDNINKQLYIDIIVEFYDILSSFVTLMFMSLTPRFLWKTRIFWLGVCVFSAFITPYKQGKRYKNYNCIRNNKHCRIKEHKCNSREIL